MLCALADSVRLLALTPLAEDGPHRLPLESPSTPERPRGRDNNQLRDSPPGWQSPAAAAVTVSPHNMSSKITNRHTPPARWPDSGSRGAGNAA